MDKTKVTKDLENKVLIIERTFDAPAAKVWEFYSNKEKFESWWGPEGWETKTSEFSLTPGGKIQYAMKCVDPNQGEWFGKESWGLMEVQTVEAPNKFSVKDYFCDADGKTDTTLPAQQFEVELVETDGKTTLISRSMTDSPEATEQLVKMGMVEGFDSQMNKLETLLKS